MVKVQTASTRLPRGTRPVMQAFFTALDALPEASRPSVAKAAQLLIRDELKVRRDKTKAAAARDKAEHAAAAKAVVPAKAPKPAEPAAVPEPTKPRPRKRAEASTAA